MLIIAFSAGWFLSTEINQKGFKPPLNIRENPSKYKYINPLLLIDRSSTTIFGGYGDLQENLTEYVNSIEQEKGIYSSVYFQNLDTGTWTAVNVAEKFAPSSMLKVAVLIVYLKLADEGLDVYQEVIPYAETPQIKEYYNPHTALPKKSYYSVKELLVHMILESDNDAMFLLVRAHRDDIIKFYKTLNLPDPTLEEEYTMSPKTYSGLFRILYNSSYLPRDLSEEALKLLTLTKFNKGLVSGVASSTVVAHKFGEHGTTGSPNVELHDCGIVYTKTPYFICVMTRGKNYSDLEEVIGGISRIVYTYIEKSH